VGRLCCLTAATPHDLLQILTPAQEPTGARAAAAPTVSRANAAMIPRPVSRPTKGSEGGEARLRLLGPVILEVAGQPIHFRRSMALPLLTYLVLHPGICTSEDLCTALWPQEPANVTKDRLYATQTSIRKGTDPSGVQLMAWDRDGYRINREQVTVDLWQLHDAALQADASPADDRASAWRRVTDLYTGTLAEGWRDGWLDPHREAARRIALDAYTALADEQPGTPESVDLLQAALRLDPVNEYLKARLRSATPSAATEPNRPRDVDQRVDTRAEPNQ
jgi:DNA-binding SARP family transcriptional activator